MQFQKAPKFSYPPLNGELARFVRFQLPIAGQSITIALFWSNRQGEKETGMAKRYQPSAGGIPEFRSQSVTPTSRPARVGPRTPVNRNAEWHSHDVKGRLNNRVYTSDCRVQDCIPPQSRPSIATLDALADAKVYGMTRNQYARDGVTTVAVTSKRYRDHARTCQACKVLLPFSGECGTCSDAPTPRITRTKPASA
jgi:hypothetical protein